MAGIFICLKSQVCNHYCIILFSVKWIIFWRYTLSATVLWNATSGGQPLVIHSHGVTVDTSTVPAHFSPASSPPQSLESCVQLPMSCLRGHTDVLLWGSEPSLGLHLDLVAPRAYRILSLFPQAQKKLSVWLRGELFLPLFLSVNFFPLLTSSIGPPNSPLGRAGITGWWMRNSPLDTLKIVDFLIIIFLNCCIKILFNLDCWGVIIIFWWPLKFCGQGSWYTLIPGMVLEERTRRFYVPWNQLELREKRGNAGRTNP